jgi:hypothetical protein
MAWRIHDHVLRGEIDNRERGQVKGRIWLAGVDEPMLLELKGDCHPDLAGCFLAFSNPKAIPMTTKPPMLNQRGTAGDMTAARKTRVPDVPVEEFIRLKGRAPWHWANSLYLEWYTEWCGRVVIESSDYQLKISEPAWRFTAEELAERDRAREEGSSAFAIELRRDEEGNWSEFRHEQLLRESDARTEQYGRLLEKYADHPDCEEIVAREMGWTKDQTAEEEAAESEEVARRNEIFDEALEGLEEAEVSEPDPAREGIDWVRDRRGEIVHPIEKRTGDALDELLDETNANPALDDREHPELGEFVGLFMTMRVKLAGALSAIAEERGYRPEAGFTIALLKRIIEIHNQVLAAAGTLEGKSILPPARLQFYRTELFGIREDLLALIERLREGEA